MYAVGVGFALASTGSIFASVARPIGKQSKEGLKALPGIMMAKQGQLEVERIRKEQEAQGLIEQLVTDVTGDVGPDGVSRLSASEKVAAVGAAGAAAPFVPATTYLTVDTNPADFQNNLLAYLKATDVSGSNVGAIIAAAVHVADLAKPIPTTLHTKIVVEITGKDAIGIKAALTLPVVLGFGVGAQIAQDLVNAIAAAEAVALGITAPEAAAATGIPTATAVHVDNLTAAAAFGITFDKTVGKGGWKITRPLSLSTQTAAGTADVLHFHQGDFNQNSGFFVGLAEDGNYTKVSDANKAYALSNVQLLGGTPVVNPIAPMKVMLNAKPDQVNPIHGQGLSHVLVAANDNPIVVGSKDQTHVHVVTDYYGGTSVLTNQARDLDVKKVDDYQIRGADNNLLGVNAKVFDIAATNKEVKFFNAGYGAGADRNLIFAAVADNADLKAADPAKVGIAVLTQEVDHLNPLKTATTNVLNKPEDNAAVKLDLTSATGKLAVASAAKWAAPVGGVNQGDVNLWWDDRYQQLFGTVAGLEDGGANNDGAFGLFRGKINADAFELNAVAPNAVATLDSKDKVAAAIFGTRDDAKGTVNLYRPRTMHTSTDKNYLLVSGGVSTETQPASRAWVNALPLMPPGGANAGELAKQNFKGVLGAYNKEETPHVDRVKASFDVIDEYTPFIVGRSPAYLASVAGAAQGKPETLAADTTYNPGSFFGAGTNFEKGTKFTGEVTWSGVGGTGLVTLTADEDIPAASAVTAHDGVTFDSKLKLGDGSILNGGVEFVKDTSFAGGNLQVLAEKLSLKPSTILKAGSKLHDVTIGKGAVDALVAGKVGSVSGVTTFGGGSGDKTTFPATSTLGNKTMLAQGSQINQNTTALTVDVGGVVTFDATQQIAIAQNSITNLALTAGKKPVGLHKAEDNPVRNAVQLLQGEATAFAIKPDFSRNSFGKIATLSAVDATADVAAVAKAGANAVAAKNQAFALKAVNAAVGAGFLGAAAKGAAKAVADAGGDKAAISAAVLAVNALAGPNWNNGQLDPLNKADSAELLRANVAADASASGKEALGAFSKKLRDELDGMPAVGSGLAVADAMTQEAITIAHAPTTRTILGQGFATAAAKLAKVPEYSYLTPDVFTRLTTAATKYPAIMKELVAGVASDASSEAKLIRKMTEDAIVNPDGSDDEKLAFVGAAITAGYAGGAPRSFEEAVTAAMSHFVAAGIGAAQEAAQAVLSADAFKAAINYGFPADIKDTRIKNVYDAAVQGNPATRKLMLQQLTAKAETEYALVPEVINSIKVLNKAAIDLNAGIKNFKLAQDAVSAYATLAGPPAEGTAKKFIDYYAKEDTTDPQFDDAKVLATAIVSGTAGEAFNKIAQDDSGFAVLTTVANKVKTAADFKAVTALKTLLPKLAFDTLLFDKYVGAAPVPTEFYADNAAITFQPNKDIGLDETWRIGVGSTLSGITVDAGTWQFGAGTTLKVGTQLPAWTLFNKGVETDYWAHPNGIKAADGFNLAVDDKTPFGGQWMLGKIEDFTSTERAKLSVTGADLELKKGGSSLKIAADRKIASNIAAATDVAKKYVVTIPANTVLPAGTKITAPPAGFKLEVGAGELNFTGAALLGGASKVIEGNFKVHDPAGKDNNWTLPDGLTVEFPSYPTKLPVGMNVPVGTMIKSVPGVDVSATFLNGADHFKNSAGANALALLPNGVYVLPAVATVGAELDLTGAGAAANLPITNDPLFTAGIINGGFSPVSSIALPYTPQVNGHTPGQATIKLRQNVPQTFAPGSVITAATDLAPVTITVAADKPRAFPQGFTAYSDGANSAFEAETCFATGSKFVEQDITPDAGPLTLGTGWKISSGTTLPIGTVVDNSAGAVVLNTDYAAVAPLKFASASIAPGAPALTGFTAAVTLTADWDLQDGLKIIVPAGAVLSGGTLERTGAAPAPLNAKFGFKPTAKSGGVVVAAGSVLGVGTKVETGFAVEAAPLGAAKLVTGPNTDAANLSIKNAAGAVTVLNHNAQLGLAVNDPFTKVEVGIAPLTLGGDLAVGAGTALVAGGSTLGDGTIIPAAAPVTLVSDLTMNAPAKAGDLVVADALGVDSIIKAGSQMKAGTAVVIGGLAQLKVVNASTNFTVDNALSTKNGQIEFLGTTKAHGAASTLTIPSGAKLMLADGQDWTLAQGMNLTGNVRLDVVDDHGKVEAKLNSTIGGAYTVTADSPYATSATDMQIIGDTVYIALEGDRVSQNGIEAGVFKSTAVFDATGVVRGWTPWARVGAGTDAVAFFGHSEQRGDLVYLTSPDGKSFVDAATNSLINPATTVKTTGWGDSSATALATVLAPVFATGDATTSGVNGLFDFGPDTAGFKTANRRYTDPYISMMVATGYERVSIAQTGKRDGETFSPITTFDKTNVFNFGPDKGLAGLGPITCAELTRNAKAAGGTVNWLFVGGNGGMAVLVKTADGDGQAVNLKELDIKGFPGTDYSFVKLSAQVPDNSVGVPHGSTVEGLKNIRKIVADEATGYVYVVTKDCVLRINPTSAAFNPAGAKKGKLVAGAANDFVLLADVDNSQYNGAGGDLMKAKGLVGAGANAEYTDLVILQSQQDKKATKLLLATTNGLVKSDPIDEKTAGDAAALKAIKWNAFDLNGRDGGAKDMGAVLRMQPVSLQSSGRMVIDTGAKTNTFEGNLRVLATDKAAKELREYRLDASAGDVKPIVEATNKDAAYLPYFVKYGSMEPKLINDGNQWNFPETGNTPDLEINFFQQRNQGAVGPVPELPTQQMINDAIVAAAAGTALAPVYFDLGEQGLSFDDGIYLPFASEVVSSASGSLNLPSVNGLLVNE
jgi:acetyltransferase-like isoleucine patch superfamily enzyme